MSAGGPSAGRLLVVDDELELCALLEAGLSKRGFTVTSRTSGDAALALLDEADFDAIVVDLNMPGMSGLDVASWVAANRPDTPVVVITAFGSLETAVAAIRSGAYDFVTKPFEVEAIGLTLGRAVGYRRLQAEVRRLRRAAGGDGADAAATRLGGTALHGGSPAMLRTYDTILRAAATDASILVTGESGTGKELVARALHDKGRRASGPFVAINCGALPESLLESELFGHARGSFTDARTSRAGLLVKANGGTLFLDEIGEAPGGLQTKLLRALEERRVRPVGGDDERAFDARIVCATNRDLEAEIEGGRFRSDLYYRINVIRIDLPPLRARGDDVLLLAQRLVEQIAAATGKSVSGIAAPAAEKLLAYAWPGNVRELRNCIERAVALTRFEEITVADLPESIQDYRRSRLVVDLDDPGQLPPLEEMERRYILRVLEAVHGHRTRAAEVLGLDRKTLYRKLERYGIQEE
ncbi:MAG TPA: sigma-54 dependent transcriptional regulator [Polyangia bacterium]|nr:sigma-54 dependent transcriptional regulator [Polyangia bacterium]